MTPAYFSGSTTSVGLTAIVRRSTAANVYSGVLERELFRALRQQAGLSYTAASAYEPRGDGFATVSALADALPEKQDAVLGGFVDVLAKLRVGRLDQSDVDAVKALRRDALDAADASAGMLSTYTESAVTGSRHPARGDSDALLIAGADGVSLEQPSGLASVRFGACAAMLMWPDGARMLVGDDAMMVRIEPTLYAIEADALRAIDASVPAQRQVRLPARDPQAIPQPPVRPVKQLRRLTGNEKFAYVALVVGAIMGVACSGLMTFGSALLEDPDPSQWVTVGFFWAVTLMFGIPALMIHRRRRT